MQLSLLKITGSAYHIHHCSLPLLKAMEEMPAVKTGKMLLLVKRFKDVTNETPVNELLCIIENTYCIQAIRQSKKMTKCWT